MSLETSGEQPRSGQRWLVLDDATVIRAMAHPARLDLMALIGRQGRLTTADAARELGISHGLASHHLHQLAKYGFVEQTEGKDNRERPWRLVFTSQRMPGTPTDPEVADAADVLERICAEQAVAQFADWQRRRRDWPGAWNEQTGLGQTNVYLTFEELAEVSGAINDLLLRYVNERPIDDLASRPPGSVPVSFTTITVPMSSPPEPPQPPQPQPQPSQGG